MLVVALLSSAPAIALHAEKAEHDPTCFEVLIGFPASGQREADAESVLASVRPRGDAGKGSAVTPMGTMKADTCSEDEFGELTIGNIRELFRLVKLTQKDSFVDLGSGLGEVPLSAAVLSGAQSARGVELRKERHEVACENLVKLSDELDVNSKNKNSSFVELVQGDMLKMDLREDTVVFTNNYCFRQDLNDKLAEKLASELPEGARIASTKAFVDLPPRIVKVSDGPLPMGEGVSVSLYEVQGKVPQTGKRRSAGHMSKRQLRAGWSFLQERKRSAGGQAGKEGQ